MNKEELLASLRKENFPPQIIEAFEKVKREDFIPKEISNCSYSDTALPIGYSQTISQPYTIAVMLSLLRLKKNQKVLEVGSGSGYVLALLSEIVGEQGLVYGVEIIQKLAEKSKNPLKNYTNVTVFNKDGKTGLPEKAPFDRILISAACTKIPDILFEELENRGILVAPVGDYEQSLKAFRKEDSRIEIIKEVPGFVFVKFV